MAYNDHKKYSAMTTKILLSKSLETLEKLKEMAMSKNFGSRQRSGIFGDSSYWWLCETVTCEQRDPRFFGCHGFTKFS